MSDTLTIRDCQAMRNFFEYGISFETLAEHYECSIEQVTDIVMHRPWLLSRNNVTDLGQATKGKTWWESDHSDPLELVKLYYPHMVQDTETQAQEFKRNEPVIDWEVVYEKANGSADGSVRFRMDTFFQEPVE